MKVILDACVLYPAPLRDLLLNLADVELFEPKWSNQIQEEWIRNLLLNRPDLTMAKLKRTERLMNSAFPYAIVKGYKRIVPELVLPDENDRHVLAAGIKSNSEFIVTFNIKDFPAKVLKKYGIMAIHPDEFVLKLLNTDAETVEYGFFNLLKSLKNPPMIKAELIQVLERNGLLKSMGIMKMSID